MRVALYLRYSSDMQSARSIEDQERSCREFAQRNSWTVVDVFQDAAVRAGAIAGRAGWQALLSEAKAGAFDLILVEEASRFSRDWKGGLRLAFDLDDVNVKLADTKKGIVRFDTFEAQVITGLQFAVAEQETQRLGERSKRGLRGKVEAKFSSGGRPAYGYQREPVFSTTEVDVDGRPKRIGVRLVPHPIQAPIVVQLFSWYADGESKHGIASRLNRDGIPSRDGGTWSTSSVKTILENQLYSGTRIWNRHSRKGDKIATSGKKQLRKNSADELVRIDGYCDPLVEPHTFARVQERLKIDRERYAKHGGNRTLYLLSGLTFCAACGHGFSIGSRMHKAYPFYRCGYRASRGASLCSNKNAIAQPALEERVKSTLDAIVKDPARLAMMVAEHNRKIGKVNQAQLATVAALEAQRAELGREQANLVSAIGKGSKAVAVLVSRLEAIEEELAELEGKIQEARTRVQPLLAPAPSLGDFTIGSASIFSGDRARDRTFLTELVAGIDIHVDGSVVVRFRPESLFAPATSVRVPAKLKSLSHARIAAVFGGSIAAQEPDGILHQGDVGLAFEAKRGKAKHGPGMSQGRVSFMCATPKGTEQEKMPRIAGIYIGTVRELNASMAA